MADTRQFPPLFTQALEPVTGDVRWRQALYGGLLGAAGVVLAWVVWVLIRALFDKWADVVRPAAVGALVGMFVEFVSQHLEASAREVRGEPEPAEPAASGPAPSRWRRLGRRAGGFASLFLLGAFENLAGDRISNLLRPFFISMATFLPVGAVFAWMLHAHPFHTHSWGANVLQGLKAGLCSGAAALLAGALLGTLPQAGAGVDWYALATMLVWWVLLGVALGWALHANGSPGMLVPALGTGGLLVIILLSALPTAWTERIRGVPGLILQGARPAAELVLTHPGLPASVLAEAEARSSLAAGASLPAGAEQGSVLGQRLARAVGCEVTLGLSLVPVATTPEVPLPPLSKALEVRKVVAGESSPRFSALCKDLRLGSQSGLLRSWLVLGVFSLGLGAAYTLEARLRPRRYTGSGTQRRDSYLFLIALLLMLVAVVAVRFRIVT